MFLVVQRTDTMPELRALLNTDHVISVTPVFGGTKSKLVLDNGETWEIGVPFVQAQVLFHAEPPPGNR